MVATEAEKRDTRLPPNNRRSIRESGGESRDYEDQRERSGGSAVKH